MSCVQPLSAVSQDASLLIKVTQDVMRGSQRVQSLFGAKDALFSELLSTVSDLYIDEDQEPVSPRAIANAEKFIYVLPDDLPNPAFGVDPDGEISITWHVSRTRIFSVSISDSERIAYAWLDGSNSGHGVDRFSAPVLPEMLVSALRTICHYDSTALRFA